jgi:hypothetical protein
MGEERVTDVNDDRSEESDRTAVRFDPFTRVG